MTEHKIIVFKIFTDVNEWIYDFSFSFTTVQYAFLSHTRKATQKAADSA